MEQRHERQRQIEAVRQQQKMFGEPTKGDLFKQYFGQFCLRVAA
jgi:hypothetical protein